ncbi:hypothetical protein IJ103_00890 [Candidatus Saccharibacteria bacterium]|nr:hypothetical protein [Candidatus Saccharibacteria bacterium]
MFCIFTGDDREKISREVKKILGEGYEVFEGENLKLPDVVNICQGMSLFAEERKILIRDLTPAPRRGEEEEAGAATDFYAELIKYLNTPHTIVIWETYTSRRKSFQEFKKAKGVEVRKCELGKPVDANQAFAVVDLAFRDGKKAVGELRKIEDKNDPYMFVGLLTSKLCTKYQYTRGAKEKQALLELAELDKLMKTTSSISPWTLVESFLLRLSL